MNDENTNHQTRVITFLHSFDNSRIQGNHVIIRDGQVVGFIYGPK
jgi:hypothetical protein